MNSLSFLLPAFYFVTSHIPEVLSDNHLGGLVSKIVHFDNKVK